MFLISNALRLVNVGISGVHFQAHQRLFYFWPCCHLVSQLALPSDVISLLPLPKWSASGLGVGGESVALSSCFTSPVVLLQLE